MKKKLLVFISIITLTLNFLLVAPKSKALTLYDDYNAMIVGWEDNDEVWLTYFDMDGTYTVLVDIHNILDDTGTYLPILFGYENKVGIKLKLTLISVTPLVYHGEIVKEKPDFHIFNEDDMIEFQIYEYKGIYDNKYLFQQGLNFYKVPIQGITFKNEISGEIDFITTLKPGNFYVWIETLNEFWLSNRTPDYIYNLGYQTGLSESENSASNAYRDGYEAGSKLAEGLLESEYQRGLQNGFETGFNDGYNNGYQNGFDNAYNEIITSDEYTLGYNDGFKAGEKSQLSRNTETFYNGIEKWLVPAIITVIVLGGIMSISALKRREQ